jgi:hypothetical protein
VADVLDHPLSHEEVGELGETPGGEGEPDLWAAAGAMISLLCASVKVGGRPSL